MINCIHQQMQRKGLQTLYKFQKTPTGFDAFLSESQIQNSTSINTSILEAQY